MSEPRVLGTKYPHTMDNVLVVTTEGLPGYELTAWIGSFVPAGTPRPIVEKLNAEIRKALEHPDVAKNLSSQTLDPMPMTIEEFAQRLRSDYDKYERVVRISGARIE